MVKDHLSRKLAVILHADVVGSTLLVQKNEILAHECIQAAFNTFSRTISAYGGKAREIRGDALVAEFDRASDAVTAAIAFQALNVESNATIEGEIKPELRIGISLGEVVIADNTITGVGVVLAQRLEQLAKPGGIVVQGSVSETVPTRMPFEFEGLGEKMVKGFDRPVRAFSVRLKSGEILPPPDAETASRTIKPDNSHVALKLSPASYEALIGERLELPDKPSIAVLPFQNMSGDPEQEYFADGMAEDIITALSRVPDLVVISRNSTFIYKGRTVDVRQVGQELGVRHVLEGSIRKSGDRLRITAQLVNTQSGDHVWAERFDRNLDDIFDVQDDITHNIVVELQAQIVTGEHSSLAAVGTNNVEAWELVTRASPLVGSHVRENALAAKQLLNRALELDSNYSAAWADLGWIYWEESVWRWVPDPEKSMQMAFDAAQKALSSDVRFAYGHSLLGHVYMVRGDTNLAIAMSEKAIELAPSNSKELALLANVLIDSGRLKEGIQKIQKAIRLSPFPRAWQLSLLGTGFHLIGENESAVSAFEQAIEREPDSHLARVWLASTLAEIGRLDEAHIVSKEVISIDPAFSALNWADSYSSKSHERLKDNLLAAGLPE
jgi:adenylate cyclase